MGTTTEEVIYEIDVESKNADSNLDNLKDSLGEVEKKAGGASGGLKKVGQVMTAIATNPIAITLGLIAGIFKTLSAAAKRNEKAMENINKVMAYFKGTIDGLLNALAPLVVFLSDKLLKAFESPMETIRNLGKALKENIINRFKAIGVFGESIAALFRGDFKESAKLAGDAMIQLGLGIEDGVNKIGEAINGVKDFVKEVGIEVEKAIDMNKRLANSELALLRIQKDFELQQLTFQQLAEDQRQIRDNESKSIDERIAANKELGAVLGRQLETELDLAQKQFGFAQMKQAADGVTLETETELLDARNKIAEINERIHAQTSEQMVNETSLIQEQADLVAEIEAKRLEDIETEKEAVIQAETDKAAAKKAIDDKARKEKVKNDKIQLAADKKLAALKVDLTRQGFAIIGGLADEESATAKGVAVAEIGYDTVKGAMKAWNLNPPPSPLGIIGAGLTIAAGLIAVKNAMSVKIPTRKGSKGGTTANAPSIPNMSVPSFTENLTDDINTDQGAAAINDQAREPLRAIVVLDDISEATEANDNINDNSSL